MFGRLSSSLAVVLALLLARLGSPVYSSDLSAAAEVGKQMFFDTSLSGSGKMACGTCHDPDHAYAPANDLAVQPGGKTLSEVGTRAVPSLCYKEFTPAYDDTLDNPDGISAPGPGGGFTQDGRAPTLAEQARIPLLAANEMANDDPADVVKKLSGAPYSKLFKTAFGENVFDDVPKAFTSALAALQAFQLEDPSFHHYTASTISTPATRSAGRLHRRSSGVLLFTTIRNGAIVSHATTTGRG